MGKDELFLIQDDSAGPYFGPPEVPEPESDELKKFREELKKKCEYK